MMLTPNGPKTLEFNCRFGDPETQVILPLLESDLYEVMEATCDDRLHEINLKFRAGLSAVGVVMASKGYPETSTKGCVITGLCDGCVYSFPFFNCASTDNNWCTFPTTQDLTLLLHARSISCSIREWPGTSAESSSRTVAGC